MCLHVFVGIVEALRLWHRRAWRAQALAGSDESTWGKLPMRRQCRSDCCGSAALAAVHDLQASDDVRVLARKVAVAGVVEGQIERVNDARTRLFRRELPDEGVLRLRAAVAEYAVLFPVADDDVEILSDAIDAAKLAEYDPIRGLEHRGR